VLLQNFTDGVRPDDWIDERVATARMGHVTRYTTEYVETTTDGLGPAFYREDQDLRSVKRDLGLRRAQAAAASQATTKPKRDVRAAVRHLERVAEESPDLVLQTTARSFRMYLK